MDTDDLTEMAWDIIVRSARVSDTLKAELGAMARQFQSEDAWLRGICARLEEIADGPAEYVDFWDLECEEGITTTMMKSFAMELRNRIDIILAMPMNKRGTRAW